MMPPYAAFATPRCYAYVTLLLDYVTPFRCSLAPQRMPDAPIAADAFSTMLIHARRHHAANSR